MNKTQSPFFFFYDTHLCAKARRTFEWNGTDLLSWMLTRIHWKYLSYWNKKCQRPNQETKPPATHTGQVLLGSASDQIPSVQNLGVLQRVFLFQGPIPSGSVNHPTRQAYSAKTSAFSRSYTVIGPFSTASVNLKNITCFKGQSNMPSTKAKSVWWPSSRRGQWEVMSPHSHIHLSCLLSTSLAEDDAEMR